jgi:hypothetical protein
LLNIYELISKCSDDYLQLDDLYQMILKLSAGGTSTFYNVFDSKFSQSARLSMTCVNSSGSIVAGGDLATTDMKYFWNLAPSARIDTSPNFNDPSGATSREAKKPRSSSSDDEGLKFYAVTDKYSPSTQNIAIFSSPVAFFTGFVIVIGTA